MAATHDIKRKIGHRLAAARRFRGWQINELARMSGVDHQRIEECESTGQIYCEEFVSITRALQLSAGHFFEKCALCGEEPDES